MGSDSIQKLDREKLLKNWLYIPCGIVCILATCFGVNKLLQLGGVVFPASVACLVVLFLGLLVLERVIGEYLTRRFVALLEIPGEWSLRWISILFTPSFVMLPLSPPIGGIEVLKIIAVFVIGFIVMMGVTAYMTRGVQLVLGTSKRAMTERAEELGPEGNDEMVVVPMIARSQSSTTIMMTTRRSSTQRSSPSSVLPIYLSVVGYAMPLHLTLSILAYFAALSVPLKWRQYLLHPILVSSLFTVLGIWVLGLMIKGHDLRTTLREFRTGATYLKIGDGGVELPGAGDVFASLLDAGIVSLALPMYHYRRELKQHFLAIVLPNVAISIGSLFAYPYICFAIGISAQRSLAFSARSLTLALANPAVANLGGDPSTVAALAILSGILGVLIGQRMLALLKTPDDDYVTRGVTLGANSSAIATALLLRTDPRAAALSSLSMSLFSTITVLFTAVPPIATVVRSLVSL
ncbi:LrgB-like family-domain-containing protein [Xylariaceae sp. FL0594]|nr:LrgB-like family-domain-containing protein [Xylariaceae sp. FL0594]